MINNAAKKLLIAILAAGASRRMGFPKLLQTYGAGKEGLLERAIRAANATPADSVCVITGAYHSRMESHVLSRTIELIYNDDWESGQSTSVITAVRHCRKNSFDSLLVMLADQPWIHGALLSHMIEAMQHGHADAYRSVARGYKGSPCGFRESCFSHLEALTGDEGARQFFQNASHLGITTKEVLFGNASLFKDIDTPQDFAQLEKIVIEQENTSC